jgi:hypothetical protein
MLSIENDGQNISASNYWDTNYARNGYFFLSFNAGAARLLMPPSHRPVLRDMRTASEVIISRGPWPDQLRADAIELMFEDGSTAPFALHFGLEQVDRLLTAEDEGKPLAFTAWARGPIKTLALPARYRRVANIPCMEPWPQAN